ncbi:exocyst complex component Sec10 [Gonapodya prolifera JEL478]|uniref:Exocyst complex component Sec10 n=1 Tax=Gonapodya prolifera (strain JEL478) TaxID=1344416 RepID=A0A139AWV6_GONPJ|nr:exocyst complex component Sec10 [Gonapodya prolifera JEL478]|eukprot:KXS21231.1 exocyst complex component Sec10 [Gonapodya prolifera JEL478]
MASWANFTEQVFSEEAFVEGISQRLVEDSRKQNQEFHPKVFIRTFESAVEEVTKLRKSMLRRIADLEDTAGAADSARRKRLAELNGVFEEVYSAFDGLENRISAIGNTAVRIGEQLEVINKQKAKATEARDVIVYFLEMQSGDNRRLESLRQSGPDGEYQVAIISRRLSAIAKEIDAPGTEKTRANIERYCEELEKTMLDSFDNAYRSGDVKGMAYCAKTLYDFNGGSSCVQAYVNQHEFFIDRAKVELAADGNTNLEEGLTKLFTDIEETIKREWEVMCVVFPNAAAVMQQFIGRVYAQSAQSYIETMLENAERDSKHAYLRGLASAHSMSRKLVKTLRFDDIRRSGASFVSSSSIINTLERCHEDLFIPYTKEDRYLQRELKFLLELYDKELSTFTAYYNLRKQQGRAHVLLTTLRDVQSVASSQLLSLSIPGLSAGSKDSPEAGKPAAEELLSLDISVQIITAHAEAIARCVELTKPSDLPRHILALFKGVVDNLGRRYVEGAIDMVLEDLSLTDSKSEPAVRHLTAVKVANQIMQLLQLHSQNFVVPFVNAAPTLHREMVLHKNGFFADMEDKINKLLGKQTDVAINWMSSVLGKQKKNEYKPKEDVMSSGITSLVTPTCVSLEVFLRRVAAECPKSLEGENLNSFLRQIGTSLHSLLLDHLKKFSVNSMGGLFLTKDLATYQEAIATFKQPVLDEKFELLRQIGNLFVVRPENLRTVIGEGYLGKIDRELLVPYVNCRADVSTLGHWW